MASGSLALWLCNGFVTGLILTVFGLRKCRKQSFTLGDLWLAIALCSNVMRMVGDYYVNSYGTPISYSIFIATAPPTDVAQKNLTVTGEEAQGLVTTGKLLVPTRVAMAFVIWSLNMAVMDVLRTTLLRRSENKKQLLWSMYTVLALTFIVTILAAFIECQPMNLNWVLLPDVSHCSFGTAWILTYEISNVTIGYTMGFILVFLLLKPQTPRRERAKVSVLVIWVIWGVVIMIRVIRGDSFDDIVLNRIVWGSVEVLFTASAATLPIIWILLQPRPRSIPDDITKELRGTSQESSTTAISLSQESNYQVNWPLQHVVSWDNLGAWEPETPVEILNVHNSSARRSVPTPQRQARGSIIRPQSAHLGNPSIDSWQAPSNKLNASTPSQLHSPGMEAVEDNNALSDALAGWIEMDNIAPASRASVGTGVGTGDGTSVGTGDGTSDGTSVGASVSAGTNTTGRFSPEPEGEGIMVATQIHRGWDKDSRVRVITIPPRARVDRGIT
ncbi:hypothetical protein F4808DRAFT_462667 [Astrocystis sublimbata]|nr:hypothetical protein F4808DRAFT_462667 [Astrocystis sublimbata]